MGHGNSDKLYITHAEHAGFHGSHSSSTGFKYKPEAPHPGARTPFDCCALSFQPFTHPVCARNSDGTGTVFDLVNIVPWLKQHNNSNPITKETLSPSDLITLNYSRKEATGEIHDPISFKPFSEHSHIVAIATTGNVFLAESIKGGKDLVSDTPFKKGDVITLQNPHGLPPASVPDSSAVSKSTKATLAVATKPAPSPAVTALKTKAPVPWNVSPYSSGMPGASLTSTSVDPTQATSSKLLWDEEELMFEDMSRPLKGKGKEKDVGKRRAYVRVVTTLGGASLNLELYCEKAPKTCYNFLSLARAGKYNDCLFHRLVPGFMIQTGDPTGTGSGGESCWGTPFRDEHDLKGAAIHDSRGILAMANKGANSNGSQFYLTFKEAKHLDKKHTVFGKLVGGEDVLDALEKLPIKPGTERPAKTVRITEVIIYQDPFEEYKKRLANKLAKRAEGDKTGGSAVEQKKKDDVNWFGVKVGSEKTALNLGEKGSGGVGKYLALKRPSSPVHDPGMDDAKKKRRVGFGDFEGW
ncbi:cyclophilin-like domain-containing protein [Crassisporium funariophilum]|nr:cyclophilin-like domain-containing protein [Crassisporium funariophilum]